MAYFSNGNEGMCLDDECADCIHGEGPCPIYYVQTNWNYKAANNKVAREILDFLVKNSGTCAMKSTFPEHYKVDAQPIKMDL